MQRSRRRLDKIDEIATGIFEYDSLDGPHALWLTAKSDAKFLEPRVLGRDVFRDESSGRDTGLKKRLLISARRRKSHWFKDKLSAHGALGRANCEPPERSHGNIVFLFEPNDSRIEVEGPVLIVDHDAC